MLLALSRLEKLFFYMDLVFEARKGICFEKDKRAKAHHIFNVYQYVGTGFLVWSATKEREETA